MMNVSSIQHLEILSDQDIYLAGMLERCTVRTFISFVSNVQDALCRAIGQLEENPQNYPSDESEDATTQRLVDMMKIVGYEAHHNKQSGGNVDITIALARKNWKWIAEAKKYGDVGDLREGYLQLASRYRPGFGDDGTAYAGLIGYFRRPNPESALPLWESELKKIPLAKDCEISACSRRTGRAFYSKHAHKDFPVDFLVWHTCAFLHFSPDDKSGRSAARYKE